MNAKMSEMYGYTQEEATTLHVEGISSGEPPYSQEQALEWIKKAARGEPQVFEWHSKDKTGRLFWSEVSLKRAYLGGKERILAVVRDISERKHVDLLKDDFIGMVSHELRTPLSIIKDSIYLIAKGMLGEVTDRQKKYLTISDKAINRLSRMIEDLLDISRITAGKVEIKKEPFDLVSLIKDIVKSFEGSMSLQQVTLKMDIPDKKVQITADKDKLIQIFFNLIGNALKFTKEGSISVGIRQTKESVECHVADTGIGVDLENLPFIFDKFRQFAKKKDTDVKGTGLGLSICKGIVELHKGKIWAESKYNNGLTVFFTLPRK